ncbi:serine hydrolase domain-containing protein [uncultured Bradyrhizobium sp.]|uniref:serine hydrolase domain-containing protein n=1 Tax=uncultured Bradyrhizobium sp. TaxID=199684 RepID=UPI0035CC2B5E
MNRMTGFVFGIGIAAAAFDGAAIAQDSSVKAALDTSLRGAVEAKDVPGVVALVTDRERVLYQGAFGVADVSTGRPLASDALFRIASMTKPVTSVAVMQLVEQGRIGLDDAAEKYLPELAGLQVLDSFDAGTGDYRLRAPARPPTVRHFLTHTSGLAYGFTSAIWRDLKPRAGDVFPFGGPLLFDPGERWHYSTSTDVAGKLVEAVSGQKLEDYFRQHIFAPLKMDDTSYNVPETKGPRLVAQQQRAGERMDGPVVLQNPQAPLTVAAPIGGGGLASTAEDYGRFVRMLLNGGALDGARVLKPETVALMGQNHIGAVSVPALKSALPRSADFGFIADGRDKWGLGFLITADQVPGKRSPGSLSWGGINNTFFWVDPARGIAGVIMMQYLPFADAKALAVYDAFERGAYQFVNAER